MNSNDWLKHKGYIHLTPQLDIVGRRNEIISKVTDKQFVKSYAFFPLVHSSISERRYKKSKTNNAKSHSFRDENGRIIKNIKERPLHYSCHMDSLIFGYYASILQEKYEKKLKENEVLSNSIIAYRRIPIPNATTNKSTIHFAKEAFDEIASRVNIDGDCAVLMFDIKSFFSRIDHSILEKAWENILGESSLPSDHKNVFNGSTRFSYVLYDDLRKKVAGNMATRMGLDEKKIAEIRKLGKHSFFASVSDFRESVKSKKLTIFKYPFRNKEKEPVGIPQGLAISAVLANLYLLNFDEKIFNELVLPKNIFYRRYSDDILIICKRQEVENIKKFISDSIEENKVEISKEKTEEYLFQKRKIGYNSYRIVSIKIKSSYCQIGAPLVYLGFEYYGEKILIKSANLSKFYRRIIYSVKSKAKQAKIKSQKSPDNSFAIYRRQLYKLYILHDLNATKIRTTINRLSKTDKGHYQYKIIKVDKQFRSNYLTYVNRVCDIMNDNSAKRQIRKHKSIFNESIRRHLDKSNLS